MVIDEVSKLSAIPLLVSAEICPIHLTCDLTVCRCGAAAEDCLVEKEELTEFRTYLQSKHYVTRSTTI